jgi:predicted nucleic acid-binding protein
VAFVLDASAALRWCFQDEATVASEALLARARAGEKIVVISHWPTEVLNGLIRAERRGRVDEVGQRAFLNSLLSYDIQIEALGMEGQWTECLPLVQAYTLSAYDAAYLALAKRLNLPLATFDDKLTLAARIEGISLAV